MDVDRTRAADWIMITINDHETSECRLINGCEPDRRAGHLVAARETGLQYDLEEGGDVFYILTNADGAKDFKIDDRAGQRPAPGKLDANSSPHEPGRLILSVLAFKDYLVRLERKDGLPRIVVRDRPTGAEHVISFDEEAYLARPVAAPTNTTRRRCASPTRR